MTDQTTPSVTSAPRVWRIEQRNRPQPPLPAPGADAAPSRVRLLRTTARPTRLALLGALTILVGACGTNYRPAADPPQHVAPSPWPSAADYATIKTAVAVRDNALFDQPDWRRKSFAASLAARTLETVRISAGPCAAYATELYGNLRDLMDAYPGEDWRPLIRFVRHQPPLARACKRPESASTA
jgi:hypothetical protein